MNVINKLLKKDNFTNIEKNISTYIIEHKDEIATLSIQSLAEATYSSNAAIIRLVKKIGCNGYKDFKIQLIRELESNRESKTFVDYNYPFHSDESSRSVLNNMALLYKNTINALYSNMDEQILNSVAKLFLNADTIYYYAVGDSRLAGMVFDNKLNKLGKKIINTGVLGDADTFTTFATSQDAALIISYRGMSENYIKSAKLLKRNKVPVVVLTSNEKSELLKYATYSILIPAEANNDEAIATFYASIAFNYVLDVLYSLIYRMTYTSAHQARLKVVRNQRG